MESVAGSLDEFLSHEIYTQTSTGSPISFLSSFSLLSVHEMYIPLMSSSTFLLHGSALVLWPTSTWVALPLFSVNMLRSPDHFFLCLHHLAFLYNVIWLVYKDTCTETELLEKTHFSSLWVVMKEEGEHKSACFPDPSSFCRGNILSYFFFLHLFRLPQNLWSIVRYGSCKRTLTLFLFEIVIYWNMRQSLDPTEKITIVIDTFPFI